MTKIKANLVIDNEKDFIEEPGFNRKNITALNAVSRFGIIFVLLAMIISYLVYIILDQDVLYQLSHLSYINPLFSLTIIYIILKIMITNLFTSMVSILSTFKSKTLYEGDEHKFIFYMLILDIIYSLLIGLFDYLLYHSIMHATIYTVANIASFFIILPSLTKDIKKLYIY